MNARQELSSLIGEIYDATLDGSRWNGALQSIASFVPGSFVNLFSQDATRKSAEAFYSYGIEPKFLELYFQKYMHINPLFPAMLFFEPGRILTEEDVMPKREFFNTRFYKEWVEPQGLVESMASVLEKSAISVAGIAIGRSASDGPVNEECRERLSLIVPHIRRAHFIGKVVESKAAEAAALADVLDGLDAGAFLLAANGRIVHANASGLLLLADGRLLKDIGGRLTALDAEGNVALQSAWSKVAHGDEASDLRISIPLPASSGDRYVAHLLPLVSGIRRRAGSIYDAIAAIFVSKATMAAQHPIEALAKAYKLTPTEMRVLMTTVHIGGVPEVAPILGISETTVKTHLSRIFAKTGAKRQADLVKLVAGHTSPLS